MRARRKSKNLQIARQRLAGLKKIKPKPDFGPGSNPEDYEAEVTGYSDEENEYNGEVAALDDRQNRLNTRDRGLGNWNTRILSLVKGRYGADSYEYELVGGVRTSERKKPTKKKPGDGSSTK
jgi:hypothetical protein